MIYQRIVLIGFSGTGKSAVGRRLAERLDWTAIDTDRAIEIAAGQTIPDIFANQGESAFREIERRVLLNALDSTRAVIATGGGACLADELWTTELLRSSQTLTVSLESMAPTILNRLQSQQSILGETIKRPLLDTPDPLARISEMKTDRQEAYDRSDLTLVTDTMTIPDVVDQIGTLVDPGLEPDVTLSVPRSETEIFVRPGVSDQVGQYVVARMPNPRNAFVITDTNVERLHAARVLESLAQAGLHARVVTVPAGESSKSWSVAGEVVGKMLDAGLQRNDVVIALGGGMVGDLAGFAASVALRGVGIVQLPTSLLAMVDSSIGGKTGVNHPTGKNLIGSFYQPPLVLIDPLMLQTLPGRELTQGWAEVVKHAIIQPSTPDRIGTDLVSFLARNRTNLLALREPAISYLIRRNIALKASVVAADEREAGLRAILNYGHTIGHAIEASGYRYLHGEAISVGMHAVNRIATESGRIDTDHEAAIANLLSRFGLPNTAKFDPAAVKQLMQSDKKRSAGAQTWVMPRQTGGVELVTGIDESLVDQALSHVRCG